MIPAGYMLKKVVSPPDWLSGAAIDSVYSVSNCISESFFDYIDLWQHNGWWLFDSPSTTKHLAKQHLIDAHPLTLFYYEVFENQYDAEEKKWRPIEPEASMVTDVEQPATKHLSGYDVVSFYAGNSPECSPLSCNSLAAELRVNRFCLFDDFGSAYKALEQGKFTHSEPGPYRIFAVYTVD